MHNLAGFGQWNIVAQRTSVQLSEEKIEYSAKSINKLVNIVEHVAAAEPDIFSGAGGDKNS